MPSQIFSFVANGMNPYADYIPKEKPSKPAGNSFQIKRLARQVVVRARSGDFVAELLEFKIKGGKKFSIVQRKMGDGGYEKLSISPRTKVSFFEALKIECTSCHEFLGCQYFVSEKISYCKDCPRRNCDLKNGKIEAMDHPNPETCDSCKKSWDDYRGQVHHKSF